MDDEELKKKIMQLVYIHKQLEREWTGVSLDGKKQAINPHQEKVEVLQEVLSFLGEELEPTKTIELTEEQSKRLDDFNDNLLKKLNGK